MKRLSSNFLHRLMSTISSVSAATLWDSSRVELTISTPTPLLEGWDTACGKTVHPLIALLQNVRFCEVVNAAACNIVAMSVSIKVPIDAVTLLTFSAFGVRNRFRV
jgi:hypothetical protein